MNSKKQVVSHKRKLIISLTCFFSIFVINSLLSLLPVGKFIVAHWLILILGIFFFIFSLVYLVIIQKEEESQLNAYMETVSDGLITLNSEGVIKNFNSAAVNIFGYSQNEALDNNISRLIDKSSDLFFKANDKHSFNINSEILGETMEVQGVRKDGRIFPMELSLNEMEINGIRYFIALIRDISDRKKIENKLKQDEEKAKIQLRELQQRINAYISHIQIVTSGDLTKKLRVVGNDALADLGENIIGMTHSLNDIANDIIVANNDLSTGIIQLQETVTNQAASAAEQATAVTEISSVIEEIRATSSQTLEKAKQLGEISEQTQQEGEKGQKAIYEMTSTMTDLQQKMEHIAESILSLSEKTAQIGEITDAVSDIAKQSKMLALNASIEAAKAGESGKGFAVVANEVKELAQRSQSSTEKVHKILHDIRRGAENAVMVAEEGTKGVNNSLVKADSMSDIMISLREVIQSTYLASKQIVTAVQEESTGVDQVVISIREIDKVTQQFSTSAEQTKQATYGLSQVAKQLKDSISVYKVTINDIENE